MSKRVLITGGAGFIGSNLADRLTTSGARVTIFDNLSRPGVTRNVAWLTGRHGDRVRLQKADVRDASTVKAAVAAADQVFHLAAQVAVTTSILDPITDYEINVGGTINVLEAIRSSRNPPSLVFTSTNKVYGALDDLGLTKTSSRYQLSSERCQRGITEQRPLEFHSPYGCSKGAADQYILDYVRTYGISAVVFRMSCIYGPRQMGTEDQGWIAHFLIRAIKDEVITICGDGYQVRDALFVDDLVNAFLLAQSNMHYCSGEAFNIGGGMENSISLVELLKCIRNLSGKDTKVRTDNWRTGDQKYYVSDTSKFRSTVDWKPEVAVQQGIERLYHWLQEQDGLMSSSRVKGNHAVLAY